MLYQVSAVSFAWLCGGDWVYCPPYFDQSANVLIALTVSKGISQVNVVYHCGNSDQMALPSVDFLNPLPLCLFVLIFKLVEIPSSLSYAPINKKGVRCKDAEMRDIR